jgi:hypothetical protein
MDAFINRLKITKSLPSFNPIPFPSSVLNSFHPKTETIGNPTRESPGRLLGNNMFFSAIGPSYDCRERLNLFPTPSRSPHDDWGNRFEIKGKRAVRSSNAEKSRLGRMASHNVYILWKKIFQRYVPMQFLYVIEFVNEIF